MSNTTKALTRPCRVSMLSPADIAACTSNRRLLFWSAWVYAATFVLEAAGVETGGIFGSYRYGETLGLKLFEVPLVIGFNRMIIILGLSELSRRPYDRRSRGHIRFVLEPVAMALDYWSWEGGAVPVHNYIAWFIISFFAALSYGRLKIRTASIVPAAYLGIQFVFFTALLIAFGLSFSLAVSFGYQAISGFRLVFLWGPEKTEGPRTGPCIMSMVVTVGVHYPLQVFCPRREADKTETSVKHDIVEEEVAEAVEGDAETAGRKRRDAVF